MLNICWLAGGQSDCMDIPEQQKTLEDLIINKKSAGRLSDLADVKKLEKINIKK